MYLYYFYLHFISIGSGKIATKKGNEARMKIHVILFQMKNLDCRYTWNFDEFYVKFAYMDKEILAGKFLVRTILNLIPNCKVSIFILQK